MIPSYLTKAINEYLVPLDGWTTPERGCEMAEVIMEAKPKVVVEIGTFGGRSAIAQAFALRQVNNGGKLYSIDPWKLEYAMEGEWKDNRDWYKNNIDIDEIHKKCMHAFWDHNLDEWVVVIRAASQHVHQLFPSINVLVIDGNHSEVASLRDAELYVPKVVSGGYIWVDDDDWEVREGEKVVKSTAKMIEFIERDCELVKKTGNARLYKKK